MGILVPRDAFQQKDLSIEMHLDSGALPICGCHRRARDAKTAVLFNVSEDAEAEADAIDQMAFDAAQPLGRHANKDGASQSVNNAFVIAGGRKCRVGTKGDAHAIVLHSVRVEKEYLRQDVENLLQAGFIRAPIGISVA